MLVLHVGMGKTGTNAILKLVNDQYEPPRLAGSLMQLPADSGIAGRAFHAVDPCIVDLPGEALDVLASEYDARNAGLATRYGVE